MALVHHQGNHYPPQHHLIPSRLFPKQTHTSPHDPPLVSLQNIPHLVTRTLQHSLSTYPPTHNSHCHVYPPLLCGNLKPCKLQCVTNTPSPTPFNPYINPIIITSPSHPFLSEGWRLGTQQRECRIERLNAQEPRWRIESEAGVTEFFDESNEQFDCAGVSAVRRTIQPGGLLLPSFSNAPILVYVVQG